MEQMSSVVNANPIGSGSILGDILAEDSLTAEADGRKFLPS